MVHPWAKAAEAVVNEVLVEAGGSGGVISMDSKGAIAMPFNTSGMYRASVEVGMGLFLWGFTGKNRRWTGDTRDGTPHS